MFPEFELLRSSAQPAIHYKFLANILRLPPGDERLSAARQAVSASYLARELLAERDSDGRIPLHPYQKWCGAHWVLATLADLGYPAGDEALKPLMEQVYDWLLGQQHSDSIPTIRGLVRQHASMESNALYASLTLGLADQRSQELAERLMSWQWPDGGWNCDKRPAVVISSFHESLIPLRALSLYARESGDARAAQAAERSTEIFLKRQLYLRQQDGSLMDPHFLNLHYPSYWHYDILSGLKVMAEAGFIGDPRCTAALDWLESRRLPGGGFPSDQKYYYTAKSAKTGRSRVNWGPASPSKINEFVTADAVYVLVASGRWTFNLQPETRRPLKKG